MFIWSVTKHFRFWHNSEPSLFSPLAAADTYEEMVILVSVSSSIFFRFLPSFPISLPTRLLWARIFRGISSVLHKQGHKLATTEMHLKISRDSRRPRLTPSCHQPLSAWCPWSCGTWRSSLREWSGWWSASPPLLRSPYDGCPPYQRSDKASWRDQRSDKALWRDQRSDKASWRDQRSDKASWKDQRSDKASWKDQRSEIRQSFMKRSEIRQSFMKRSEIRQSFVKRSDKASWRDQTKLHEKIRDQTKLHEEIRDQRSDKASWRDQRSEIRQSFVKRSEIRQSFMKRSEIRQSFMKRSEIRQSFVKRSEIRQSFMKRSEIRQSFMKSTSMCLKSVWNHAYSHIWWRNGTYLQDI